MWWRKQRDCQHLNARTIHGDEIIAMGWRRGDCPDCGRLMRQIPRTAARIEQEILTAHRQAGNGPTEHEGRPDHDGPHMPGACQACDDFYDRMHRAADNGEPELDDQVAITGQYPPTGDTVWPPADNGEPE